MEYRDFQDCKSILCDTVIVDNGVRLLPKPTEIYNAKSQPEWMQILKITYRDFPGGPMVRTVHFQRRVHSIPVQRMRSCILQLRPVTTK